MRSLLLILLLFVALASVYNALVPLGEGPDEPGHLRFALFLAHERQLPVQRSAPEPSDVPGEGHQPPLAYLLLFPAVAWLPPTDQAIVQTANPNFVWNGGTEAAAFLRASHEYPPWRGITLAWHLARAISTLLGGITLWCIWAAARAFFAHQSVEPLTKVAPDQAALLVVGLVALQPQFLFTSALVTNDMLLITLSAALFWLCLQPPPRPWVHAALLGLLTGLALITKLSALLLVPLVLWALWRHAAGQPVRTIQLVGLWAGVVLLIAGWWFVRNWQLYGDPLGLATFQATYATQPFEWQNPAAWGAALVQLASSYWAYFGWLTLSPPAPILWLYAALVIGALVGLLRLWPHQFARSNLRSPWIALFLLPLFALAWVVSFALIAGLVGWQGRLLFPALPAFSILLVVGLLQFRILHARRAQLVLLFGLGALALYLPFGVIDSAYRWQVLPPDLAAARIERPTYARYAKPWEQGIELHGWRLQRPETAPRSMINEIHPGETLDIILTWHALERIEHNWTVFIHLVNENGEIVAEHNSIPQNGQLPLPLWTPGDWLEDTHPLELPADLPSGGYDLRVGLYLPWQRDPQKGRRQEVWDTSGTKIGDLAVVGTIQVASQSE